MANSFMTSNLIQVSNFCNGYWSGEGRERIKLILQVLVVFSTTILILVLGFMNRSAGQFNLFELDEEELFISEEKLFLES